MKLMDCPNSVDRTMSHILLLIFLSHLAFYERQAWYRTDIEVRQQIEGVGSPLPP